MPRMAQLHLAARAAGAVGGPAAPARVRVRGQMEARSLALQAEATLQTLTLDVLKSSEIEGEHLPAD